MDSTLVISKRKSIALSTGLFTLAFCVPLLFNGSQVVTGCIVNALLFISATRLKTKKQLMLAVIPSLGAISHGVLFGAFTMYLIYFLPFIWIGNYLLMHTARKSGILSAALIKSLFLFLIAYFFVSLHIVPKIFLTAMGMLQLVTAIVGGIVAIGISKYLLQPIHE